MKDLLIKISYNDASHFLTRSGEIRDFTRPLVRNRSSSGTVGQAIRKR